MNLPPDLRRRTRTGRRVDRRGSLSEYSIRHVIDSAFASPRFQHATIQRPACDREYRGPAHHPPFLSIDELLDNPWVRFHFIPAAPALPIIAVDHDVSHPFHQQTAGERACESFRLEDVCQLRSILVDRFPEPEK